MTKSKQHGNRRRSVRRGVVCIAIVLVWSGFTPALRGQERARPAEDHAAIAARYRQEATETRDTLKRHRIAADVYRKGSEEAAAGFNPQGRKQMVQHCERLIAYYTKAAEELDAMAAEHEALAKQPASPELPERRQ